MIDPRTPNRIHFDFLDGMRGLAALYVVIHHASAVQEVSPIAASIQQWLRLGHWAVGIFIVLSGYCLMLPVVQSSDKALRDGIVHFVKRRARRILPPYYAALAFALFLLAMSQGRKALSGQGLAGLPDFTLGNVISHLLLVHNFFPNWVQGINPPLWSVALEWQIYLVFAFLLLPVWRRFGILASTFVAFAISTAPHFLLPLERNFDWTYPWYVGLFALGMAGASIGFSGRSELIKLREGMPWGTIALLFGLTFFVCLFTPILPVRHTVLITDVLVGLATTCAIMHCAQQAARIYLCSSKDNGSQNTNGRLSSHPSLMLRCFQAHWLVSLGVFSYSLYLTHVPILWMLSPVARILRLSPDQRLLFFLTIGVGITIIAGYLFHLIVERRYLSSHQKRLVLQHPASMHSPAS